VRAAVVPAGGKEGRDAPFLRPDRFSSQIAADVMQLRHPIHIAVCV
jgi:hypothetical protein